MVCIAIFHNLPSWNVVSIVVSMELVLANLFTLGLGGSRIGKGESGSGQVREWGAGDRDVGGRGGVACDGEWLVVVGCYLLLLVFIGCCSLARLVSPSFPSPPSPPS